MQISSLLCVVFSSSGCEEFCHVEFVLSRGALEVTSTVRHKGKKQKKLCLKFFILHVWQWHTSIPFIFHSGENCRILMPNYK